MSASWTATPFSAARIAELVTEPGEPVRTPTAEQRSVIEYDPAGRALVVAGAGSGKTETMASRVVWLIANDLVRPEQVLGLTFTRKAAGELAERVTSRLTRFAVHLRAALHRGELTDLEAAYSERLDAALEGGLNLPEVSTYDAFAASIVQEFGATVGTPPGLTLIDETVAWGIASDIVRSSRDPALVDLSDTPGTITQRLIRLSSDIAQHLTTPDEVDRVVTEYHRTRSLPYSERELGSAPSGKTYAAVRDSCRDIEPTLVLTRLVRAFDEEKRRLGVMQFSDQLRLAVEILQKSPEARGAVRARYAAVLLDEVQDTSVSQTRMLASVFSGAPVMAVGDPHQAIYGWRGASAEGMTTFHEDFQLGGESTPEATLNLTTSWRNPRSVLEAANAVSEDLRDEAPVDVPPLEPRPAADEGSVEALFVETVHEEREALAAWIAEAREAHRAEHGEYPTAAVLVRTRSALPHLAAVLTRAGIPNRIEGIGGLLTTPEVTDLVSALRCVWYADAGGEAIRLLAGPRFAIGVRDLQGLRRAAAWFANRGVDHRPLSGDELAPDALITDPDRAFTILDALDEIADLSDLDHRALAGVSVEGRERLREAGRMLRSLRTMMSTDPTDIIRAAEVALRLDIELQANETRSDAASAQARANIDRFLELVEGFLAVDEDGTLASVLAWLDRATEDDEAAEHVEEPQPGTVQLLTVHGSKGLEWDVVAVPHLVEGVFPSAPREGSGWLRPGQLPDELRGDAASRPRFEWRTAVTQKDVRDELDAYREALREHRREEERRLAYVAVTRAKSRLLVSGAFWDGGKKPRRPAPYLEEIPGLPLPEASAFDSDPSSAEELTLQWPLDPLGTRRDRVMAAADAVRAARERGVGHSIDPVVALLLAERDAHREHREQEGPPISRITASSFHEFIADPEAAERAWRRPVPQRPFRKTRLGNRFHEWVERRIGTTRGTLNALFSADESEWDLEIGERGSAAAGDVDDLIEKFERSRFAVREPLAVELELTIPFAGTTLACKLDAVYTGEREGEERVEIVDWKTGRSPSNDAERAERFFQLDLYRHAYAAWAGVAPERIDVTLFYIDHEVELTGDTGRSLEELEELWRAATGGRGNPPGRPAQADR